LNTRIGFGGRIQTKEIHYFVFLIISIYVYSDLFYSKWWIFDDHEVFFYLGSENNPNSWGNFLEMYLKNSEIADFGMHSRYRPSFYFFRVLETLLWKDSYTLWYSCRFIIQIFFLLSIYRFLLGFCIPLESFLITVFLGFQSYLSDIFSRLGVGEFYCILGIILILESLRLYKKNKVVSALFLSVLGSVIAIGSKENFFFLSIWPLGQLLYSRYKKSGFLWILVGFPIFLQAVIFFSLFLYFKESQTDIYGNSTRFNERLKILFEYIQTKDAVVSGAMILFTLFATQQLNGKKKNWSRFLLAVFVLLLIINLIFYNGKLPANNRYDLPFLLAFQVILLYFVYFSILLAIKLGLCFRGTGRWKRKSIVWISALCVLIPIQGIKDLKIRTSLNRERTEKYTRFLERLNSFGERHSLVFVYSRTLDFEPLESLFRYMKYKGFRNRKYILDINGDIQNVWESGLSKYVQNEATYGNVEKSILPIEALKNTDHCILFIFEQELLSREWSQCQVNSIEVVDY